MSNRTSEYPILDVILNRWSPRAMSGKKISHDELSQLFEAARWAPSSYNNQPWHFIYAHRETPAWNTLFNLMVPFNQSWAKHAGVLLVAFSKNNFDHNNALSRTHSFDTGGACQALALQGEAMGLIVHGMEGFDYDQAKKELNIPDDYTVEAMFAIGRPGRKDDLPKELQEREIPSGRKLIEAFTFEGRMK